MKQVICFNPYGLHGLPQHRINPLGHIRWSSPNLVRDVKTLMRNLVPRSGASNSAYFESNAQRLGEAIALTQTKIDGELTLPALARSFALLAAGGDGWIDFAYEMHHSGMEFCRLVESEIHQARQDTSGGFKGIVGELSRAFACMSDPQISDALSPPYDFDMADLCNEELPVHLYIIVPDDQIEAQAAVIKAIFVRAMVEKARRPDAPRLLALIDECGQLAETGFDLVPKLFSFGAGVGVQPFAVFQNARQMAGLARGAEQVIPASAGCSMKFAIRELNSARMVSAMIGDETLEYRDELTQARARAEEWQIASSLLNGADPFAALPQLQLKAYERRHSLKIRRPVRTPDEILTMPRDRMVVFADGLSGPIYAERQPYWTVPEMAGRYHPNPYHPPDTSVSVMTPEGQRIWQVIEEPVPQRFAHLPQYAHGLWSRISAPSNLLKR